MLEGSAKFIRVSKVAQDRSRVNFSGGLQVGPAPEQRTCATHRKGQEWGQQLSADSSQGACSENDSESHEKHLRVAGFASCRCGPRTG